MLKKDVNSSLNPPVMLKVVLSCFLLALCENGLSAQSCGGGTGTELLHRFDGPLSRSKLGWSVAGVGDLNGDGSDDVIAGAPGPATLGTALVFSSADGTLLYQIQSPPFAIQFAEAVAGAGDVNGDGIPDFIVGTPWSSPNGITLAGSAFVYSGADGTEIWHFPGFSVGDGMGNSVAGAGDVNLDGFDDVIVGAPYADAQGGTSSTGAAFVYSGASGAILFQLDGPSTASQMGCSVAGPGDVNGDGRPDFLVGAKHANPNGMDKAGSAFVFSGLDGSQLWQFDGDNVWDFFATSVSGANDLNQDGFRDVFVGAPGASGNYAHAYSGLNGSLLFRFEGFGSGAVYGSSVSSAGDVNGDGFPDLLVGAEGEWSHSGLRGAGAAYVYSGVDGSILDRIDGEGENFALGFSVSGAGDANGDGLADIVVGSIFAEFGSGTQSGAAYLFSLSSPYLSVDQASLSTSAGGEVNFDIDFPVSEAGRDYALLASFSGNGPWTTGGGCIPLTPDALTAQMWTNPPGLFLNPQGILDFGGNANPNFSAPAGALSAFVGVRVWFAGLSHDGAGSLHLASSAVTLDILP
ncbi:MAG: hypothetical protein DWQ01_00815 [Planctomycetota bacterium]|nr:MAG: hypothetical protein DWQ01_00815 [Planctomycetota bacterium]